MKKLKSFIGIILAIIFIFGSPTKMADAAFFSIPNKPTITNLLQNQPFKNKKTAKTTTLQTFFSVKKNFYNTVVGQYLNRYELQMLNNQFDAQLKFAQKVIKCAWTRLRDPFLNFKEIENDTKTLQNYFLEVFPSLKILGINPNTKSPPYISFDLWLKINSILCNKNYPQTDFFTSDHIIDQQYAKININDIISLIEKPEILNQGKTFKLPKRLIYNSKNIIQIPQDLHYLWNDIQKTSLNFN